jgi:hypothetical protein
MFALVSRYREGLIKRLVSIFPSDAMNNGRLAKRGRERVIKQPRAVTTLLALGLFPDPIDISKAKSLSRSRDKEARTILEGT